MNKNMKFFFGKKRFEAEDQFEETAIKVLKHSFAAREIFANAQYLYTIYLGDMKDIEVFCEINAYIKALDAVARQYKKGVSCGTWRRILEKLPMVSYKDEYGDETIIRPIVGDWQV